jgi:GPH family glycoside/pentoside/hexuronide:cation symporter
VDARLQQQEQNSGTPKLLAFASLGVPLAAVFLPLGVYLPPFYAQTMGMGLQTVGLVFMASRLWNALCDPLVGFLSDHTKSRFGRRKPWIAAGSLLFIAGVVAVYWPPHNGLGAVQLAVALFALYLGWTMVSTPLAAWASELSTDYHERSRVQTYIQTGWAVGLMLTLLLPALLDQVSSRSPFQIIAAMGSFAIVSFVPCVLGLLLLFREPPRAPARGGIPVARALKLFATNPLVLRVMASDFFVATGQAIRSALFVFFVSAYMGLPKWASLLFLLQFAFGIFAAPIWLKVGYRLGKHRTVVAGEITQIVINLGLLFIAPGDFWPLLALTIAQGLAQGSGNLMLRAIVSDIADDLCLKTGKEQSGLLFSIFSVTNNAAAAAAVGIAYPLIAWFGFVPGHANAHAALAGLAILFAVGPATGHALSAMLVWRFPLDERRHGELRAALAERDGKVPVAPAVWSGADDKETVGRRDAGAVMSQTPA